jgi:alanine dehydrogenase
MTAYMKNLKIGLIKEGKTPPDFRVALTPEQCNQAMEVYPNIRIVVQSSAIRKFTDQEYLDSGISVVSDVTDCDVLIGVKEVPIDQLIPEKTYLFFSHTIKKQPYNAKLLKAIMDKRITLIDYEVLKDEKGKRVIGFGRYAGIVGVFEGFRALGLKYNWYQLPSPISCHDRIEMESHINSELFQSPIKAVVTGYGRVGLGAEEMIQRFNLTLVSPEEFSTYQGSENIYTHLDTHQYYQRISDGGFDKKEFYQSPELYKSILMNWIKDADIYFACHLWKSSNPFLITAEDLFSPDNKCKVIADISCDVNGPIASTIKASTIADPFFGYCPKEQQECNWQLEDAIMVMSIDNLPCELPRDASEDFGSELIKSVIPALLDEDNTMINGAMETQMGELTKPFEYLKEYALAQ